MGSGSPDPLQRQEEEALARGCLRGEPEAWRSFVERYSSDAYAVAVASFRRWGIPASQADLDDVVQETLFAFLRGSCKVLRSFRWQSSLAAYVRSVAVNRCVDQRRRMRRNTISLSRLQELGTPPEWEGSADQPEREEISAVVRRSLEQLPGRDRRVVVAYYWEGASSAQIAWMLRLTEENVRAILSRARKHLRKVLEKAGIPVTDSASGAPP